MNNFKSVRILGGSAAGNFKGQDQSSSWPYLLKAEMPSAEFDITVIPGLTFMRSVPILTEDQPHDLLIFHFGTSIGWPSSIVKLGHMAGIDFSHESALHQSAFKSSRPLKHFFKVRFRNLVKYLLFFFGLYKSRINLRELEDQIRAVHSLASHESRRIIWIQHRALQNKRIFLERRVYERFYARVLNELKGLENSYFGILELPEDFLVPENYLLDCVHLSDTGHGALFELVKGAIASS